MPGDASSHKGAEHKGADGAFGQSQGSLAIRAFIVVTVGVQ